MDLFSPLTKFYIGLDRPNQAIHFERAFVSINSLVKRENCFPCQTWIMDSGAFTELSTYGYYRRTVKEYANEAYRFLRCGNLEFIVSQDYNV